MQQPLDLSQEAYGDLLLQLEALLASNHVAPEIVSRVKVKHREASPPSESLVQIDVVADGTTGKIIF